jgi:hypothetical protein
MLRIRRQLLLLALFELLYFYLLVGVIIRKRGNRVKRWETRVSLESMAYMVARQ